ncbi:cytochrome c oxidase assembly protein ctaG isoform X2 [Procambarus clarkii]|uniref:cytochrome c oxidase assembly protein ctaG isoform X2 n=1 Tax=Procambarus clarkii TaxID=6728 RepID=UPI00374234F1
MYGSVRTVGVVCWRMAASGGVWWGVVAGPARAASLLTRSYTSTTRLSANALSRVVKTSNVYGCEGVRQLGLWAVLGQQAQGGPRAKTPSYSRRSTLYYVAAVWVLAFGLSYAAVPLYRIFCQAYSYGGTTKEGSDAEKIESMQQISDRVIRVRFNADTAASMTWNFKPQQTEIKVHPGETALAFYTARNPTNRPVIGVSTYNVIPFDAGQYFNKIQCFCFEEQLLNPHEETLSLPKTQRWRMWTA